MIPATRVLLSVFLLSTIALAQSRVERNIVYGMYSGTALLMDVHYPVNANGVGVIFVPGSGWSADTAYGAAGIKDGEIPRVWVPPLTGAGYTVFVPNHRGTPAFHYPDPVHDIQRAVRFVRHNAPRFKIDANRLGGLGGSSGGHLIALMGLMDGKAEDDSGDPVDQQSAKLQALVTSTRRRPSRRAKHFMLTAAVAAVCTTRRTQKLVALARLIRGLEPAIT